MDQSLKLKILASIGKIYEDSQDCKLEDSFFSKIDSELAFLSAYFRTTKSQSFFIAMVFALNYKGDYVDFNDLIKYFSCNPMKILEYSDDFDKLIEDGIFEKRRSIHRMEVEGANDQFSIHRKITKSILQNQPMPDCSPTKSNDVIALLERLADLGEQCKKGEISSHQLALTTNKLIFENSDFQLIARINSLKLRVQDVYLFLYLIWKTILGNKSISISATLIDMFDHESQRFNYLQDLLAGENKLIKSDLVEIVEAVFFNDSEMKLTDYAGKLLEECGIKLFRNKNKGGNIFTPDDISHRKLIYSESEMKQLFLLKGLMQDEKFKATQQILKDKSLPIGITVLLHGVPGTGKTETVKQLAKDTNREIMKVEISQTKSLWYGESEKVVKKIFTDYSSFAKECVRTPILLFNEADAVLSKRIDIENTNVSQTDNAIQNILLEELENFEGILIATTNLVNKLDTAFDRRFLFKIRFQKPDISTRVKIWESKMPFLSIKDCTTLAEKFDFSGGQIDNVLRKNQIHEIIYREKVTLQNLISFCYEETLQSNKVKVGFS